MLLPLLINLLEIVFSATGYDHWIPYIQRPETIPIGIALGVVAIVLIASIAASLIWPQKKANK
jgi:hypothetical protein